jgi:RNA polymerase sigma factor (sigma-70 family)
MSDRVGAATSGPERSGGKTSPSSAAQQSEPSAQRELEILTKRFEADRPHLRAVAHRILGSEHEADDAVQEAWVRLSRADTSDVGNLTGWLTTVVSRVCLDMLRSRTARREDPAELPETLVGDVADPEQEAVLADSIGPALLLVLDTLGPAERLAFVLHDMFAVPFPEIASIVGCSPAAARQLASRARRKVQGSAADEGSTGAAYESWTEAAGSAGRTDRATDATRTDAAARGDEPPPDVEDGSAQDVARRRTIVDAFLAASRGGDFAALLALLDPGVVVRADAAGVRIGAAALVRGADAVAETFSGRARAARLALIDGAPGAVWSAGGKPRVAFAFTIVGDRITVIDMLADPEALAGMDMEVLDD